jgi:hypothetical protein
MKFSDMNQALANKLIGKRVNPSMGGDPEFFVANKRGKVLNADAFFPGKYDPLITPVAGGTNKLFFDGIQAEMAFGHSTCRDNVINNIRLCLKLARSRIPADHKILLKPSAKIDRKVIENADPEARIFGCAPDFNAYTRSVNTTEMDASRHPFRYAGGHMHLGISSQYQKEGMTEYDLVHSAENHLKIIKFLDLMVSIPTLVLDNSPGSKRRRDKYGKAGCFRPTSYGVEYRTPSCWWLRSPMTTSLVFGLAKLAWTLLSSELDEDFRNEIDPDEEVIRGIIDESDTKSSIEMWKKMRPYIAVAGRETTNPINLRSCKVTGGLDLLPNIQEFVTRGAPKFKGTPIYPIAVFEYAMENGLEAITSKDMDKEWSTGSYDKEVFRMESGFIVHSYSRFRENKDFLKFQESMLKELY